MLCKLEPEIPQGEGWLYEPKWDGFRALVTVSKGEVTIASRRGQPLARYFPELLEPIAAATNGDVVLDGEIIIAVSNGLDFEALQLRLHPAASRVAKLAAQTPAQLVVFDLLRENGEDISGLALTDRRARLQSRIVTSDKVSITPQSSDSETAAHWFAAYEGAGLDGVIAKRADQPYLPGERGWVKVKHLRTVDCVVGGYRIDEKQESIVSLLLGLFNDDGVFHFVGHTSSFSAAKRRELLAELSPLAGDSFGDGRTPGAPSRWSSGKDLSWTSIRPERVCEVSFDYLQGSRFRHAARFLRWREDKAPQECTFEQIARPEHFDLDQVFRDGGFLRSLSREG
jgi:ATP-dependent DNA ligase